MKRRLQPLVVNVTWMIGTLRSRFIRLPRTLGARQQERLALQHTHLPQRFEIEKGTCSAIGLIGHRLEIHIACARAAKLAVLRLTHLAVCAARTTVVLSNRFLKVAID